ncbi:MAG: 2Fe-2S iron-sulfur cluster binding domain-containing protein, partial [Deltaproteobacteria bacterium]|nr:2Fe-2S iron-sulfur cluster binding domain-containing protein [Deltaproteobacteria bacterium]
MGQSFSAKPIRFQLNGQWQEITVENHLTLAELLPSRFNLNGTRVSCEVQICGACTVLVDGKPVSACTTPAFDLDGRTLTTIEGLADGDKLHPIQQAFWLEGGFECGYCTPGMILSTHALLAENPDPSDAEIKHHLASNICRCTGYVAIIAAVKRAAKLMQSNDAAPIHGTLRLDGREKVRGAPIYTADLERPGMLYGKILRSPMPHARI